jgi:hypothetical protein
MAGACVLAALITIPGTKLLDQNQSWCFISDYDRTLNRWLAAHSRPDEMILPPLMPRTEIQAKMNRPALMELETLYLMTYMPSLSASIGTMARDLYGLDYSNPHVGELLSGRTFNMDRLLKIWSGRTRASWLTLGREYGFRFVLSPRRLDLPVVLPGDTWTLYAIS